MTDLKTLSTSELKSLIDLGDEKKFKCISQLASRSDPNAYEILKSYLKSDDWTLVRSALSIIAEYKNAFDIIDTIRELLESKSEYVQREAIINLKKLKDKESITLVKPFLKSSNQSTRLTAIKFFEEAWNDSVFEDILYLYSLPNDDIKKASAKVLRQNANSENWKLVFDKLKNDLVPRHKTFALELAEKFNRKEVIEELKVLFRDEDGHVRKLAGKLLE